MSIQTSCGAVNLKKVLVVGLGEIGSALLEIVKGVYDVAGYDIKKPTELPEKVDVLHICFPYTENFVDYAIGYMKKTNPELVLIESTVLPGTTQKIHEKLLAIDLCHSPVRTRIADGLKWGFYNYTKFIGPVNLGSGLKAGKYYQALGFKTRICASPLETEFSKLIHLAYFGVILGWNQEMRRIARKHHICFRDVAAFLETNTTESEFRFPVPVYDGQPIGGHCIIPGIQLLQRKFKSKFLESTLESDEKRQKE